ncbi:NAD(P)/FAD-dependent oxidoreductase [Nocardioides sp. Kera G14]|uniref:NAD(P)/FAD-dependent oxidoreductase n=1 Tax=Nocardioides sp. Kera G14 TaxID=2884264 RepID=UPI001D10B83C|nr:FAD-dependent oxidoreductase [Nocardioides sp. Kera G14]UDY22596.1 FAD-dependent oxidoreductase [Nocardioides sp. Kera G14]
MSIWANAPAVPSLPTDGVLDAVVVGGGPAGWTAAIYLARAKASPVVLAGGAVGGQLMDTGIVENFPGFPQGIDGPELMGRMREQAENAGARVFTREATALRLVPDAGGVHEIDTAEGTLRTRSVVFATGSSPRRLDVPGEAELGGGNGVAYCAVCEAPLFAGKDVAVVGGGDSAMEEVLAVSKHARRVHLVHRRDTFRCAPVLLERVRTRPNVQVHTDAVVTSIHADDSGRLATARIETRNGGTCDLSVQGLFVAIGHTPRTELAAKAGTALSLTPTDHLHLTGSGGVTAVPGVFAAGDVADDLFRQAITAAGAGCAAALACQRYLEEHPA